MKPKLTPEEARKDHRAMLRFMALNGLLGMAVGVIITGALFWFDIAGLASHAGRGGLLFKAIFLIGMPLSMLLGAVSIGTALMMMPYEKKYRDD
ncbi:hypothetical protein [Rhizobium sp. L1K21]|uniref:hypothetical protein n=1 Tax=Rhizobium sp. L1K21 TaxID=2954933 RepID=UPI002092A521|nr:hypothetical protein [Rhizobium sp. L1K21]MCO6187159.1 hypothetical protein [Rhizobium sp. L1K21]